jgi:hypothetical protein
LIWLTLLEPTVENKGFTKPIVKDGAQGDIVVPGSAPASSTTPRTPPPRAAANQPRTPAGTPAEAPGISGLKVRGLFHENPAGNKVVFDFLDSLKEKSTYFDVQDKEARDLGVRTDDPVAADRWAWVFEMDLPFRENIDIK